MNWKPFPSTAESKARLWEQCKQAGVDLALADLQAQFPGTKLVAVEIDGTRYGERPADPDKTATFDQQWWDARKPPGEMSPEQLERIRKDKLADGRRKARMGKRK